MPILDDIMDHPVIGPERRRGMVLGYEFAIEIDREEGPRQRRRLPFANSGNGLARFFSPNNKP
jgi:hypothetical protein